MAIVSKLNHSRHPVPDMSHVGEVRRFVKELAYECGLDEEKSEKASIVASELATNLAKYAEKGEILVGISDVSGVRALELISIDHGPGIDYFEESLQDGVSSKNTLGGGLGAIKRLSDFFEHHSVCEKGTIVRCLFYSKGKESKSRVKCALDFGGISVPHPKETVSGDGIGVAFNQSKFSLLILDGLGHGQEAAKAKEKALDVFIDQPFISVESTVKKIHADLLDTRGVALAMTMIDLNDGLVDFVGVGNITGRIYHRFDSEGCRSNCGVVGGKLSRITSEQYEFPKGSTILFHSDGIGSSANLKELKSLSASLMAASVLRDYGRKSDDATVVAVKDLRI